MFQSISIIWLHFENSQRFKVQYTSDTGIMVDYTE